MPLLSASLRFSKPPSLKRVSHALTVCLPALSSSPVSIKFLPSQPGLRPCHWSAGVPPACGQDGRAPKGGAERRGTESIPLEGQRRCALTKWQWRASVGTLRTALVFRKCDSGSGPCSFSGFRAQARPHCVPARAHGNFHRKGAECAEKKNSVFFLCVTSCRSAR